MRLTYYRQFLYIFISNAPKKIYKMAMFTVVTATKTTTTISGKVCVSRTIANFCIFSFQTLPKKYTKWQSMCTVVTTTKTTTSISGKVCVSRTIANFCIFSFQTRPKIYRKWQSMCTVVTTTKSTTASVVKYESHILSHCYSITSTRSRTFPVKSLLLVTFHYVKFVV